jgi:hypothetical protein
MIRLLASTVEQHIYLLLAEIGGRLVSACHTGPPIRKAPSAPEPSIPVIAQSRAYWEPDTSRYFLCALGH